MKDEYHQRKLGVAILKCPEVVYLKKNSTLNTHVLFNLRV